MRVFVALFVFSILAFNVNAATYVLCTGYGDISLKLTRNKIFINEDNSSLIDWSRHIEKYTNEEIVLNKSTKHNKTFKCSELDEDSEMYNYLDCAFFPSSIEKKINKVYTENPYSEEIIFKIDRISGKMSKVHNRYTLGFSEYGSNISPSMRVDRYSRDYKCEESDKTKF